MENIALICIYLLRRFSRDLINLVEAIVNRDVSYKVNYSLKDDILLIHLITYYCENCH